MIPVTFRTIVLAAAVVSVLAGQAWAGCHHCGCKDHCHKVCRLVCEEKKVEITCYGVKEEDFCIPAPSKRAGKHHDCVCDFGDEACKKDGVSTAPKKFVWFDWLPSCAKIHTKRKLMKRTVTKTIPTYKWVVEDLCASCEHKVSKTTVEEGTVLPPLPKLDGSVKVLPVCTTPAN